MRDRALRGLLRVFGYPCSGPMFCACAPVALFHSLIRRRHCWTGAVKTYLQTIVAWGLDLIFLPETARRRWPEGWRNEFGSNLDYLPRCTSSYFATLCHALRPFSAHADPPVVEGTLQGTMFAGRKCSLSMT